MMNPIEWIGEWVVAFLPNWFERRLTPKMQFVVAIGFLIVLAAVCFAAMAWLAGAG